MINLIIKNNKEILKNSKKVILIAIIPLLFFAILYILYGGTGIEKKLIRPVVVGVIDNDNSIYSKLLIENYKSNEVFSGFVSVVTGNYEEINNKFMDNELDAYIEIPHEFSSKLIHFEHEPIIVRINSSDPVKAVIIKNIFNSYEKYINAVELGATLLYDKMNEYNFTEKEISTINVGISYDLIMTALNRNSFFNYTEIINIPNTNAINYFFVSIVSLLIIYFGLYVGIDMLREKELKTFLRLESIGYSSYTIIISKLISHVSYLFTNVVFWYLVLSLATGLELNYKIIMFLLICIFLSVSFSILLSCIFKRQDAILLFGNVIYFISAIIGGSIIPLQFLPKVVQRFSIFTPNYWFIKGILYMQKDIRPDFTLKLSLALILVTLVFYIIANISYNKLGDNYE